MQIGDWDSDRWYIALSAIGGAALVAVVATPVDPSLKKALVLLCAGACAIGLGEWAQHPRQVRIAPGMKITGHPRRWNFAGTALNVVGAVFLARGLWLFW